ncbi:hypothetical protein [Mesorhizobium australicum]|uniref:hypothetical protein n=1 Tax=Mesorhizobium australicum TaxID=536018 RepID=UPI0012F6FB92|nr:hypothetical protein [Mesorhizobium australicum]
MSKHLLQAHKAQKQRENPSEDASKQAGSMLVDGTPYCGNPEHQLGRVAQAIRLSD